MHKFIEVSLSFEGFHKYENAPDDVAFLRNIHRHIFGVDVMIEVTHNNREIEFFQFQRVISKILKKIDKQHVGSCEMVAEHVYENVKTLYPGRLLSISVDEDNENRSIVSNMFENRPHHVNESTLPDEIQTKSTKIDENTYNNDVEIFEQILQSALTLMKTRNKQYGSSWRKLSIESIAQIAEMKLNRVAQLGDDAKSADEFIDAINYSVFGLMKLQMEKDK